MRNELLTFIDDVYEDLELWYPLLRLQEAGYGMRLAGKEIRNRNLISSRTPRDLAPFAKAMVTFLGASK